MSININVEQLANFNEVWKELLKQKVKIVYEISKHKKCDFQELLKEVLPEAFIYAHIWKDQYIIHDTAKSFKFKKKKCCENTGDNNATNIEPTPVNITSGTTPRKKFKLNLST